MKTAVYLRQSADRLGDELAISRQREDAHRLASARGYTLTGEYVDNDASASGKRVRPEFERLLTAVTEGQVQCVVAWDMTRLTRSPRDTLRILEIGQEHSLTLALVRGSDLELATPAGRLTASIMSSIARHEIEQKSDRQIRSNIQAAEEGRPVGGRKPFGNAADRVTIVPEEADAIRKAYSDLLAGASLGHIAREWTARGLHTGQVGWKSGVVKDWGRDSVRAVLLNARYAGLRSYHKKPMGPAQWPGIVSEETWRAAVDLLSNPARRNNALRAGDALLTGIGTCGKCGSTIHSGRNKFGHRTYRCRGNGGHLARQAEPINEYIKAVVVEHFGPGARELLLDKVAATRSDVDALRSQDRVLRARQDTVAVQFAAGDITAQMLRTASRNITAQLATIEKQLAEAGRIDTFAPLLDAEDVGAAWDQMYDTPTGRDRLRVIVDRLIVVTVHPTKRGTRTFRSESVGIDWR